MQTLPPSLRIAQSVATVTGADDSLESINTTQLSDRALVTVALNNSIYMLRRDSAAVESLPDVVAPKQGGPGRWFIYPSGSAGVTIDPLANVRFVDGSTAVAVPDQDGSIAAPFSTVQAALDALVAATERPAVLICPGDYSAEVLVWAGESDLQISAFSNAARGFQAGFVSSVRIGSLTAGFGVSLTGIEHGSIDGGSDTITLQGTVCNGPVTLTTSSGLVVGYGCFIGGVGNVINAPNVRFTSCELQEIDMNVSGALVEATNSMWTIGADVEFTGAPGSLRLDSMTEFYFDAMGVSSNVTNGVIVPLYLP